MEKLRVRELCHPSCPVALFVRENEGIEAVIMRFASQPEVHALFVVDDKRRLRGLVKIRHLLNWVRLELGIRRERRNISVAEAFDVVKLSQSRKIGDIISPAVSVKQDDLLAHAFNLMANEKLVELAVVNKKNELIGEIKLTEIMSHLLNSKDYSK